MTASTLGALTAAATLLLATASAVLPRVLPKVVAVVDEAMAELPDEGDGDE